MKRVIITVLSVLSVGLFANGTTEDHTRTISSSHSRIEFETIGEKQVEPNAAIITTFTNHGSYPVPAEYLAGDVDLRSIPTGILDNIDTIIGELLIDVDDDDSQDEADDLADGATDLKDMIRSQLNENIIKGEIEYTYLKLGRNLFTSSYDF